MYTGLKICVYSSAIEWMRLLVIRSFVVKGTARKILHWRGCIFKSCVF